MYNVPRWDTTSKSLTTKSFTLIRSTADTPTCQHEKQTPACITWSLYFDFLILQQKNSLYESRRFCLTLESMFRCPGSYTWRCQYGIEQYCTTLKTLFHFSVSEHLELLAGSNYGGGRRDDISFPCMIRFVLSSNKSPTNTLSFTLPKSRHGDNLQDMRTSAAGNRSKTSSLVSRGTSRICKGSGEHDWHLFMKAIYLICSEAVRDSLNSVALWTNMGSWPVNMPFGMPFCPTSLCKTPYRK